MRPRPGAEPDVVLFGELLLADAIARAWALAAGADLLLCVGSSLEVHPVEGLPELTLRGAGDLAIITGGATRGTTPRSSSTTTSRTSCGRSSKRCRRAQAQPGSRLSGVARA